ncbi:MAG TPA: hypothetical protein VGQ39_22420 [Pyrinomonadaceae bacterium]|jgi:hypothetical protein|nr:hypothetical protein [Pyrinomonadaceae bacterium]
MTGDILNKQGHVVLFDRVAVDPAGSAEQGIFVWEARQAGYDRVIHAWWPWSRFALYRPLRYRRVC